MKVIRHVIGGAESEIAWNVSARAWRASASPKPKAPALHHDFAVDRTLPPDAFMNAKREMYWEAVRWWNINDHSKRHQIPLSVGVGR